MNTYICFYRRESIEVLARSTLEAQTIAAARFKARQSWEIVVKLAKKGDTPVIHSAASL